MAEVDHRQAAGRLGAAGVGRRLRPAVAAVEAGSVSHLPGDAQQGSRAPDEAGQGVGADAVRGRGAGAAGRQAVLQRRPDPGEDDTAEPARHGSSRAYARAGARIQGVHAQGGGPAAGARPGDHRRVAGRGRGTAPVRRRRVVGIPAADHGDRGDARGAIGRHGRIRDVVEHAGAGRRSDAWREAGAGDQGGRGSTSTPTSRASSPSGGASRRTTW